MCGQKLGKLPRGVVTAIGVVTNLSELLNLNPNFSATEGHTES